MSVNKKDLSQIDKQIDEVSKKKEEAIMSQVNAPAYVKGTAAYVSALPERFGMVDFKHLMGFGEESEKHPDDPRFLIKSTNFRAPEHRHIDQELREIGLNLKKDFHAAQLQASIIGRKTGVPVNPCDTPYFKRYVEPKMKAYNITDFANWIPTLNTRFYFEEFEIDPGLEAYFEEYPMTSPIEAVPGAINRIKGRLESDVATFGAQSETQAQFVMRAQNCVAHVDISEDLTMDAQPSVFERLRRQVVLGVLRSKEDALINGDDTITTAVQGDGHMDSDIAAAAATNFNKAFKGFRKLALANSANGSVYNNNGNAVSLTTIASLVRQGGKFSKDKADLLWILGPAVANLIVTGGIPEILTIQNFGAQATLVTGGLPPIFGIKPFESEWVREDVGANGVYAASSTLTTILLVKKSRFIIGKRAGIRVWATPSLANQDKMLMTAKERFVLGAIPQSAIEKSAMVARNVATT